MLGKRLLLAISFLIAVAIMATRLIGKTATLERIRPSHVSYTESTGLPTQQSKPLELSRESLHLQTACCNESEALTVQMLFEKSDNCSKKVNLKSVQCNCESLMICKFMIVSAISDNHFEEATDFIASAQAYMPKSPIIVYNLGLSEKNKKILSSYCDVKVRDFNFSMYPKHVQNLQTYAWIMKCTRKKMVKSFSGVMPVVE